MDVLVAISLPKESIVWSVQWHENGSRNKTCQCLTGIKVDNSAAIREMISWLIKLCLCARYVGGSKSSETSRISPQIYNWIIPNLYKVCNYHFLICQCFQKDAGRSEVHDVIVWWRHASVTRSKKCPKLPFPSEVQLPTFMFHVAVIFSRL